MIRQLLSPLASLYKTVMTLRNKSFDKGWSRSYRFDLPVIVLGNLNTGGSGKTPHTIWLGEMLYDTWNLAFLSRGYGRKSNGFHLAGPDATADQIGDEPMQYWHRFQHAEVAVSENRPLGIGILLSLSPDVDVILLDDAYQHRALKGSLQILLTEYGNPYFRDKVLPAGNLREDISGAQRADWIIVSKCPPHISGADQASFLRELKAAPEQEVFFTWMEYAPLQPFNAAAKSFSTTPEEAVLVTGIANPKPLADFWKPKLKNMLQAVYSDHHQFRPNNIDYILKKVKQLGPSAVVITTEKDAMRLSAPLLQQLAQVPLFIQPVQVGCTPETLARVEMLLKDHIRQFQRPEGNQQP